MVQTVQSCKFFKDYATYSELNENRGEDDLFKVNDNPQYAKLSNYVKTDDTSTTGYNEDGDINLDWSAISEELFGDESDPDDLGWGDGEKVLKNFVRTQIYRPIFFNPTDYFDNTGNNKTFTTNKDAYWCSTTKWYADDEGAVHPLVFSSGTTVDTIGSEMDDDISDVEYYPLTNKLQYTINYDPITISNDKFVFEDVEFYVVKKEVDGAIVPTSVYYNEFNKSVFSADGEVPVANDEFTLAGSKYKIVGDKVLWAASW